jgi:hypothetical protein
MATEPPMTADEFEQLSPDQRAALVNARAVTDLDQADPRLVERARAYGRELLEGLDTLTTR